MISTKKLIAIQLRYNESGWSAETYSCIESDEIPIVIEASREGVGSISLAFNRAMKWMYDNIATSDLPEFVWMVTNVTFKPGTAKALMSAFDKSTAAVHPKFKSDHPHIRNPKGVQDVPFVEWTAPMIRLSAWEQVGQLDEQMPYWGMDLDWSYRAKQKGYKLRTTDAAIVNHAYLRNHAPERISEIRRELRRLYDTQTEQALIKKYGQNYRTKVWQSHPDKSKKLMYG